MRKLRKGQGEEGRTVTDPPTVTTDDDTEQTRTAVGAEGRPPRGAHVGGRGGPCALGEHGRDRGGGVGRSAPGTPRPDASVSTPLPPTVGVARGGEPRTCRARLGAVCAPPLWPTSGLAASWDPPPPRTQAITDAPTWAPPRCMGTGVALERHLPPRPKTALASPCLQV